MATQYINNNSNFITTENWGGFDSVVEYDGFQTLCLKQNSASYDNYIQLEEETTYTLWCEIQSKYAQTLQDKGLSFECFFGSSDNVSNISACESYEVKSEETSLTANKWQVIEIRFQTKALEEDYDTIYFKPIFDFTGSSNVEMYIKCVALENSDRRYYGCNLLKHSYDLDSSCWSSELNNIGYRYYYGYIFETTTTNLGAKASFNFYNSIVDKKIIRVGDVLRYSAYVKIDNEVSEANSSIYFIAYKYNPTSSQDLSTTYYDDSTSFIPSDQWQKVYFDITITSEMLGEDDSTLALGKCSFYYDGTITENGNLYYSNFMLEIIGDDEQTNDVYCWLPNKEEDIYEEYIKNLIMSSSVGEKDMNVYMQKIGETERTNIADYITEYSEEDISNSDNEFKIGNVASKSVSITLRNYDDTGEEILPRNLTYYIFYVEKIFENIYDDSGDIVELEGKYKVYENPEDFSSNMTLSLQDRMAELDVEYDTKLSYPVKIREQLDEIATSTKMTIDYSAIEEDILNEEIDFYDSTYNKRYYIAWIAEKASCNAYVDDDKIVFKKVLSATYKEVYIDYATQDMRITDSYLLNAVEYNNGLVRYLNSNDLLKNDDSTFTLECTDEVKTLSVDTGITIDLEKDKTYTFDYETNIIWFGDIDGGAYARLLTLSSSNNVTIDDLNKTFTCTASGTYRLNFYYNPTEIGESAIFSNFHIVEGSVPYNSTNTMYLSSDNSYIVSEDDVEKIYNEFVGLEMSSCDNAEFIIGNPYIKSNDIVLFRFIDETEADDDLTSFLVPIFGHTLTFNAGYTSSFDCTIESVNSENTTSASSNINTRIKRISITVDQNNQTLEILAQEQEGLENQYSQLAQDVESFKIEVGNTYVTEDEVSELISDSIQSVKSFEITTTSQIFAKGKESESYLPNEITLDIMAENVTFNKWQYSSTGGLIYNDVENGTHGFVLSDTQLKVSAESDLFTNENNSIIFKALSTDDDIYDIMTIVRVSDGVDGESGQDAYTIILSNESYTFDGNLTSANENSITISVTAYKGTTKVDTTIGTITNLPTGMTTTINNNGSTNTTITINVTNEMTSPSGAIDIPVTIGDITFSKTFNYAIAFQGESGENGVGVSSTNVTYQASESGTTVPIGTWSTTIPEVSENQYLWTRTIIHYTDGSSSTSYSIGKIGANGTNGTDGKGIASTSITYQASNSGTETPTGVWLETIPEVAENQYLWTRTVITYTDDTTSTSYSIGKMGATGETGESGRGISSTVITYQVSDSGTIIPTGTWSETIPELTEGQYLWTRTVYYYTDETTSTGYSISYAGKDGENGENGEDGRGISSTIVTYQAHYSQTVIPTGEWSETIPELSSTMPYLWTRTIITYTDETTSIAYSVSSTIDGIEVGGRNFVRNTKNLSHWEFDSEDITTTVEQDGFTSITFPDRDSLSIEGATARVNFPYSLIRNKKVTLSFMAMATSLSGSGTNAIRVSIGLSDTIDGDRTVYEETDISLDYDGTWHKLTSTMEITDDYFTNGSGAPDDLDSAYVVIKFLRYALKSATIKAVKLETGNTATDWTPAPEDIEENLEETIDDVNNSIVTQITEVQASIEVTKDNILQTVSETYYNKDEIEEEVTSIVSAQVELTSQDFEIKFSEQQAQIDDITTTTSSLEEILSTYFNFSEDGLTIGKSDSNLKITIINDRISFTDGDTEVAYISDKSFEINEGTVYESIRIGNFAFIPRSNGSLDFKKVI